ncbi:MAG: LysE family translocator [Desulfobacterales bacterium]|nr:LysE family translocator [Desulfobacterales bacterium]
MTIESVTAFSLALLVWVLIPGPAIFAIVGRSLTTGLKSSLNLIIGILLGDIFYISIVLFGMAAVGKILGDLFFVIRMLGAAYLIFLGLRLWLKDSKFNDSHPSAGGKSNRYKSFLAGFSITLGNPKAILFHLGFLPAFFDLSVINAIDALLIIVIFMVMIGSSLTIYAYAASKARLFFGNPRKARILNRFSGTILIGSGIALVTKK